MPSVRTDILRTVIENPPKKVNRRPHRRCTIKDGPPGAQLGPHPVVGILPSKARVSSALTNAQSSLTINSPTGFTISTMTVQTATRTKRGIHRDVGRSMLTGASCLFLAGENRSKGSGNAHGKGDSSSVDLASLGKLLCTVERKFRLPNPKRSWAGLRPGSIKISLAKVTRPVPPFATDAGSFIL